MAEERRRVEQQQREEEEKKKKLEEEKRKKDEEERKKLEEKRKAEEERQLKLEAEKRKKAEEAEVKARLAEEIRQQKVKLKKTTSITQPLLPICLKQLKLAQLQAKVREDMNSTYNKGNNGLNRTYNKDDAQSYEITPARHELPPEVLVDPDNYDIADLKSDEETDDEDNPRKKPAKWAIGKI